MTTAPAGIVSDTAGALGTEILAPASPTLAQLKEWRSTDLGRARWGGGFCTTQGEELEGGEGPRDRLELGLGWPAKEN